MSGFVLVVGFLLISTGKGRNKNNRNGGFLSRVEKS